MEWRRKLNFASCASFFLLTPSDDDKMFCFLVDPQSGASFKWQQRLGREFQLQLRKEFWWCFPRSLTLRGQKCVSNERLGTTMRSNINKGKHESMTLNDSCLTPTDLHTSKHVPDSAMLPRSQSKINSQSAPIKTHLRFLSTRGRLFGFDWTVCLWEPSRCDVSTFTMSPCVEFPQISLQIFERRLVDKLASTNQALLVAKTVGTAPLRAPK